MQKRKLKNLPLVEAFVEFKWLITQIRQGIFRDPAYPIYVGRLYEKIKDDYKLWERLPTDEIPDELTPFTVKHRFNHEGGSPIIQLGPGIASVNITKNYDWDFFLATIMDSFTKLREVLADTTQFRLNNLTICYINAVEMDVDKVNSVSFLSTKLNTKIVLPPQIELENGIQRLPKNLQLRVEYPLNAPKGTGKIEFSTGRINGIRKMIWRLSINSFRTEVPQTNDDLKVWLNESHENIETWFFALIKGELDQAFEG